MNAYAYLFMALACGAALGGAAGPAAARTQTTIVCTGCVIVVDPAGCGECVVVNRPAMAPRAQTDIEDDASEAPFAMMALVVAPFAVTLPDPAPAVRVRPRAGIAVGRPGETGEARYCLAAAIYFEARGETLAGQRAVAQVVLNRVIDRRFPATVCGVVFQNEHRPNRCQFSFACDGRPETIEDSGAWRRALRIASDEMARFAARRLTGVATHYHTAAAEPVWRDSLTELFRVGTHVFYREEPRGH